MLVHDAAISPGLNLRWESARHAGEMTGAIRGITDLAVNGYSAESQSSSRTCPESYECNHRSIARYFHRHRRWRGPLGYGHARRELIGASQDEHPPGHPRPHLCYGRSHTSLPILRHGTAAAAPPARGPPALPVAGLRRALVHPRRSCAYCVTPSPSLFRPVHSGRVFPLDGREERGLLLFSGGGGLPEREERDRRSRSS